MGIHTVGRHALSVSAAPSLSQTSHKPLTGHTQASHRPQTASQASQSSHRMNPQTRPAFVCGIEDTASARGHRMNPQTRPALVCGIVRARGNRMNPQTRPAFVCEIENPAGGAHVESSPGLWLLRADALSIRLWRS